MTLQLAAAAGWLHRDIRFLQRGHPAFQLHRENVRERTCSGSIISGISAARNSADARRGKLDCNYCHQPEPNGRYMQRVSFEANCQECHSLQFDVQNPDFQIAAWRCATGAHFSAHTAGAIRRVRAAETRHDE